MLMHVNFVPHTSRSLCDSLIPPIGLVRSTQKIKTFDPHIFCHCFHLALSICRDVLRLDLLNELGLALALCFVLNELVLALALYFVLNEFRLTLRLQLILKG
jgi:hypothetical protein